MARQADLAAREGRIPWRLESVLDCIRHLEAVSRQAEQEDNEHNYDAMGEAIFYINRKYGPRKGLPHARRMQAVISFMGENRARMVEDGLVSIREDGRWEINDAMLYAFARLELDKNLKFSYRRVKDYFRRAKGPN